MRKIGKLVTKSHFLASKSNKSLLLSNIQSKVLVMILNRRKNSLLGLSSVLFAKV